MNENKLQKIITDVIIKEYYRGFENDLKDFGFASTKEAARVFFLKDPDLFSVDSFDQIVDNSSELSTLSYAFDSWKKQKVDRLVLMLKSAMAANGQVCLMMNVPKNKLQEVVKILPEGKKPTIAELTDPNWVDLTVVLEERLVREIAPDLKTIGVEDIVEYSINKIIQ